MALLTFEGFEAYNTAEQMAEQIGTQIGPSFGNPQSIVTNIVRTGARAFLLSGNSGLFRRFLPGRSGSTVIAGCALYLRVDSSGTGPFFGFADTVLGASQIQFGITTTYFLTAQRGATVLATAASPEPMETWNYYELRAVLASTATGSYELRRNGQTILSATNVATLTSGSAVVDSWRAVGGATPNVFMDDFYVCDGAGTLNNDFLGGVRVAALRPNGNHSVGWTASAGANWQAVDDTTPNDDTDYVSATGAAKDLYTMTDLPPEAGTVFGVAPLLRLRKAEAPAVTLRAVLDSAATEVESANYAPDLSYAFTGFLRQTDPATSAQWTVNGVNAARVGVRRL